MPTKGIDVRQTTGQLVFRVSLKDSNGAKVTSGTTELRVYRVEDDGTLDVYDWTTNDFVAPGGGTPDDETTMTHQQRRDSTGADVDTGIWTAVLSTLTNWTAGQVYVIQITNTTASPESQEREFQFGLSQGDDIPTTILADLPVKVTKNVALNNFTFLMVLANDNKTGATGLATVVAQRSIDGAVFASCSNAVSEVGNGVYKINLTGSDLNGDTVCLRFTAATANDRVITIVTQRT